MKNMIKLAAAGVLFAAVAAPVLAQDTNVTTVTQTYNAQNLTVALTGYAQGGQDNNMTATKVRITNKDLMTALGGTSKSRVIVLTPVDFEGDTLLVLRNVVNRQNQDTDITGWFSSQTIARVENSRTSGNKTTGNEYTIDKFTFGGTDENPSNISFDVQGFTTAGLNNGPFNSTVNGTGTVNGAEAVLSGKISAAKGKTETRTVDVPAE